MYCNTRSRCTKLYAFEIIFTSPVFPNSFLTLQRLGKCHKICRIHLDMIKIIFILTYNFLLKPSKRGNLYINVVLIIQAPDDKMRSELYKNQLMTRHGKVAFCNNACPYDIQMFTKCSPK